MLAALLLAAAALSPLDIAIRASIAPCPPAAQGEIIVCGRRDGGGRSRYRSPIPSEYAAGDPRARSVSAERNGLFDYDAGGAGTCSAVGPNGAGGCFANAERRRIQQRAGATDPRGPLYAK